MKRITTWLQNNRMLNNRTALWPMFLFFTALLLVPLQAQNQSESESEVTSGQVTGDEVRLRGGPGTKFKPVGTVNRGTRLQIRGQEGNWTEVVPPSEATVWIYGKFVKNSDGKEGKVTATNVNIRPLPRVDQTNVPLGQVSSPKTVTIVDRKKRSSDDFPWFNIQLPEEFSAWIHSDYVKVQSSEDGSAEPSDQEDGSEGEAAAQDTSDDSSSSGTSSQAGPQKGSNPGSSPQKGASSDGDSGASSAADGTTTGSEDTGKWVDRLESIQERVRKERSREDKLDWDFSSHINNLEAYAQNVPVSQLKARANELRQKLEGLQERVRKERKSLNERLRAIQEARKEQVRNTIQDVLKAKGFTWDAIGHVRSVGNLYYERPAQFELVKGGKRIYFLQSARDILNLKNYRRLQVAVSGTEISPEGKQWSAPILRVDKIEPISK
jgi:uncharacterized protein YraI